MGRGNLVSQVEGRTGESTLRLGCGGVAFFGPLRLLLILFLLVALATVEVGAREAVVETVQGRSWQGDVTMTNGTVTVDGTNVVPLAELRRLSFDLPPPTNALPRGKGNGLLGYYFGRTNYQGSVTVRLDERVDFDWATGEPAQGLPRDGFSVIWSGDVEAPVDGEFRFSLVADDVAELTWTNQVLIPMAPSRRGQELLGPGVMLRAGERYPLQLKFQDHAGAASVKLYWQGPGMPRRIVPSDRLYAKSRLAGHASELLGDEGLLATYYRNADFTGATFTRVDPKIEFNWTDRDPAPGFARSQYSVRWQGQLKVDHTETYTIYVQGDEAMRVWLEGRPLIMPGEQYYMTEVRESVPLVAGERYEFRVEGISTSGNAAMKVMWSSPSTPKNVIPATHLTPASPVVAPGAAGVRPGRLPRGFVLADGAFIGQPVERANESVLRTGRWLRSNPVSTMNIARIYCQPVSRAMLDRIPAGRAGLLLAKGDFVDGEFKSFENGQIRIGSVLFGVKAYDAAKEVLVVVLREVRQRSAEFEILLPDQSVLYADAPRFEAGSLRFRDAALGTCALDWSEILAVRRLK